MSAAQQRGESLPADADFLAPLAERARRGDVLVRRDIDPKDPRVPKDPSTLEARRSAVLIHLAGTGLHDAQLVLEERGHSMRSQPGQFALPGGRVEPEDADDRAAALREAQEETGLDPATVQVLGAFAPLPMPWRGYSVRPVVAWTAERPELTALQSAEVERIKRAAPDEVVHCEECGRILVR